MHAILQCKHNSISMHIVVVVELSVLQHHHRKGAGDLGLAGPGLVVVGGAGRLPAHVLHHDAVLQLGPAAPQPGGQQQLCGPLGPELPVQGEGGEGHGYVPHVPDQHKQRPGDEHHAHT